MPDYRPIPDDDEDERRRIVGYSFAAHTGPYDPEEELDERSRRYWSFAEDRGLYRDDELVSCCAHIEFTARVRGTWLSVGGLTGVATPPEHRRQGFVGELIEASLAEYRDRGWPLSALRPFDESFYARYGWATGCRYWLGTVDPAALTDLPVTATGTFRRVHPDDHEHLEPVYEAWLEDATLATRRSSDWWRDRILNDYDGEPFCYCWERDGDPRGYLVYDVEESDDGRRMVVSELAAADREAYLHLLRFCGDHDSQIEEVELFEHRGDRLVDAVDDRGAVEVEVRAGQMVRVVDVPAALSAVPYPGVDGVDLALAVEDDHAPWNDRTFAVRVRDGEATVEETDADPDARVGIGALSQLLVGYRSVEELRVGDGLTVHDPAAADRLGALFPGQETFLPERF